jgi:hypothetical protein
MVTSLWVEFGGESVLVVALAGLALVEAAPVGPVLHVADGTRWDCHLSSQRGDDQGAEEAADLGGGQRDWAVAAGAVPGIGGWR